MFERTTQLGRKGAPGRVKPTIRLPSSSRDRVGVGGHTCLCVVQVGEGRQIFHISSVLTDRFCDDGSRRRNHKIFFLPSGCPAGGTIFTSCFQKLICNLYLLRLVRRPSGQHKKSGPRSFEYLLLCNMFCFFFQGCILTQHEVR